MIKLANPTVIKRSDKEIRWKVYKILHEEFEGVNPNDPNEREERENAE